MIDMSVLQALSTRLTHLSDTMWFYVGIPVLLVTGIYFTWIGKAAQIRMIPEMFRVLNDRVGGNHEGRKPISSFKAFTISAASRVGTGNIVGVAAAVAMGGPGSVFWMWIVALLGGASSFVESTLGQLYKSDEHYRYHGGPAYYIRKGLGQNWLAILFAIVISVTYGLIFNALQANSITDSFSSNFNMQGSTLTNFKLIAAGVLGVLTALIIFGGVHSISKVSVTVVPTMALLYLAIGFVLVIINIQKVPGMFYNIISCAFGFKEMVAGGLGSVIVIGVRRGLFTNEAGMGSVPNAGATAAISHPVKQGLVQTLGVYVDTLVVCTMTAFIVMLSNPAYGPFNEEKGASLTLDALQIGLGDWARYFLTFAIFLFAFTSVIGNYYYGESNIRYMFRHKFWLAIFRILVVVAVMIGSVANVKVMWSLSEVATLVMALTNLAAIVFLGRIAMKLLHHYNEQRRQGLEPIFHRDDLPEIKNIECWDGSDEITRRETWERFEEEKRQRRAEKAANSLI